MAAVICGSIAYDTIMVFQDQFKNHILPDKVHILNVSFLVPEMRREFGGCAGNIAYNLKLLGDDSYPVATVGSDFGPYAEWLQKHQINQTYIRREPDLFTAQAFMTTDTDNNQIAAFHPGAMSVSHHNHVRDIKDASLGIIAPDGRDAMLQHAAEFAAMGTPFIFDPGQAMPLFNGEEFRQFIEKAQYVTVNDYESNLLEQRTGWTRDDIARKVEAYIVTRGASGSDIYTQDTHMHVPPAQPTAIKDPTGCGDAYRAGLIHGLIHKRDLITAAHIASLMGAIKIAHGGTQNHAFTYTQFAREYHKQFGMALD